MTIPPVRVYIVWWDFLGCEGLESRYYIEPNLCLDVTILKNRPFREYIISNSSIVLLRSEL